MPGPPVIILKFLTIASLIAFFCSSFKTFFSSLTNPCTRFVNSVVYALVALFGALFVVSTENILLTLTVGNLSSLLSYANQYTKPFNEISGIVSELQNAFVPHLRRFVTHQVDHRSGNVRKAEVSFVCLNGIILGIEIIIDDAGNGIECVACF